MSIVIKILRILFFFVSIWCVSSRAITIGSNTTSSRESRAFFPAVDSNNVMLGFASFENGFTLEDSVTTCSFNDLFPVSGDAVLNGGLFRLLYDLEFKSPFTLGPGTIDGESTHMLMFPGDVSGISLPSEYHTKILSFLDNEDTGANVFSIDWSYDDQYIASVSAGGASDELNVYYFDGMTLTVTASVNFGAASVWAVRWHPSEYYIAVGTGLSPDLSIYYLNVGAGTLNLADSKVLNNVRAVAWDPTGNYLAVGESTQPNFYVYEFAAGVLGTRYDGSIAGGAGRTVQDNALDWDSTSSYIVLGLNAAIGNDVKIFHFDGSVLTENAGADVGGAGKAVAWAPSSSFVAVGLAVSSERIRIYEHDSGAGTLTDMQSAYVGDGKTVTSLDWSSDGVFLAVGKMTASLMHELRYFSFDSSAVTLSLVTGYEFNANVRAVSVSNGGDYVATGDDDDFASVFELVFEPLVFQDIELFLNSDVIFRGSIIFEGDCLINGGGNTFTFDANGSLNIASGGTVLLEEVSVQGIGADVIACADDTAVITLSDVEWQQDSDYTFSVGKFEVLKDFLIVGDGHRFIYQTDQVSTVSINGRIILDNGMTFSYDPPTANRELIAMHSDTSEFFLNGATLHSTSTGMRFTTGVFSIDRSSALSNEGTVAAEGISFATGVDMQYFPAAVLDYLQGVVVFE